MLVGRGSQNPNSAVPEEENMSTLERAIVIAANGGLRFANPPYALTNERRPLLGAKADVRWLSRNFAFWTRSRNEQHG